MKQLPIILVAVISIALGIWLGMPEQKPVTGYEHLGGDFVVQSTNGDVKPAAILFMNSDWRVDLAAFAILAALVFWTSRRVTAPAETAIDVGQNPPTSIQQGEPK